MSDDSATPEDPTPEKGGGASDPVGVSDDQVEAPGFAVALDAACEEMKAEFAAELAALREELSKPPVVPQHPGTPREPRSGAASAVGEGPREWTPAEAFKAAYDAVHNNH